jgi:predicted RNA-binding Zn-ribbon protein involved in translation (DUF1610 family)
MESIVTAIIVYNIIMTIVALFVGGAIISESIDYNNGYCPHCNEKLRHFDCDSQGGRGYTCDNCDYTIWVSYKCIDRYHSEV